MSRYYNIPNKVNLPISANSHESESILLCKPKPAVIVEHEKRSPWSLRTRHANISLAKENTPPRRAHHHSRLYKPWQTFVKASVSKIDPRLMFNFIDTNKDSRLSYWEFRSWMLIIDRQLQEHELLAIFNEIDRNADGFIQYKEFRDYFGDDLLTNDANIIELTNLFNEIDMNQTGHITLEQLLNFFNRNSLMITKEEAHVFLGMVSEVGNENRISLKEFLKAMQEWKI